MTAHRCANAPIMGVRPKVARVCIRCGGGDLSDQGDIGGLGAIFDRNFAKAPPRSMGQHLSAA